MGRRRLNRLIVIIGAAFVLLPAVGRTDPLDLIAHPPASVSAPAVVAPEVVTPALAKFQAVGRVTSTLTISSGCAGSIFATCTTCDQVQISGPVVLTPGGKGTFSACLNVLPSTGGITCNDQQGNGTITLSNGDTIKFSTGGHFCLSDEIPPSAPTSILFIQSGGYSIEGGTGKQASAVGQGEFSVPWTESTSFTSTGELNLVGNYASH